MDPLDSEAKLDHKDRKANVVRLDQLDLPDQVDQPDNAAKLDHRDQLVRLATEAHLVPRVFLGRLDRLVTLYF